MAACGAIALRQGEHDCNPSGLLPPSCPAVGVRCRSLLVLAVAVAVVVAVSLVPVSGVVVVVLGCVAAGWFRAFGPAARPVVGWVGRGGRGSRWGLRLSRHTCRSHFVGLPGTAPDHRPQFPNDGDDVLDEDPRLRRERQSDEGQVHTGGCGDLLWVPPNRRRQRPQRGRCRCGQRAAVSGRHRGANACTVLLRPDTVLVGFDSVDDGGDR